MLTGRLGFGHDSQLNHVRGLRLSEDVPLVIEIIDDPDKINSFLPVLDAMMETGLVTLEPVRILRYGKTQG